MLIYQRFHYIFTGLNQTMNDFATSKYKAVYLALMPTVFEKIYSNTVISFHLGAVSQNYS